MVTKALIHLVLLLSTVTAAAVPIDKRQGWPDGADTTGLVQTISTVNNQIGQTLTETCYFRPDEPSILACITTIAPESVIDSSPREAAAVTTIWPDNVGPYSINEQAPRTVVALDDFFAISSTAASPTTAAVPLQLSSSMATVPDLITGSLTATPASLGQSLVHLGATSVSSLLINQAVPTATTEADGLAKSSSPAAKENAKATKLGQTLEVLPIGLSVYCGLTGLTLLIIIYMFIVRVRYRRKFRAQRSGLGTGLSLALGIGGLGAATGAAGSQGTSSMSMPFADEEERYRDESNSTSRTGSSTASTRYHHHHHHHHDQERADASSSKTTLNQFAYIYDESSTNVVRQDTHGKRIPLHDSEGLERQTGPASVQLSRAIDHRPNMF